jgi:hypothetical protein
MAAWVAAEVRRLAPVAELAPQVQQRPRERDAEHVAARAIRRAMTR